MTRYVDEDTTTLYVSATGTKVVHELLWGDSVQTTGEANGDRERVQARGAEGWVKSADLGDTSLLELYFIDVGQGDGILIRTPDGRHLMLDGGYRRRSQPSRRNAADFVDWKFVHDYGQTSIELDAMIVSHCDDDHYGGLSDLLDAAQQDELDATDVTVGTLFHAGLGHFTHDGKDSLGREDGGFFVDLLDDADTVRAAVAGLADGYKLRGEWAEFMERAVAKANTLQRISDKTEFLPGFEPAEGAVAIRVLAPIESHHHGPALAVLSDQSHSTNGHSVLLRLDYGNTRVLLTGDLNAESQGRILQTLGDGTTELAADVVKACHHGSDDCSLTFLRHVEASATVISSGDAESHRHPRPAIVAASGVTGHQVIENDQLVTPLVYSTEISRSYRLGANVTVEHDGQTLTGDDVTLHYEVSDAGALNPTKVTRKIDDRLYVVAGLVYGLVNVRTDGTKVLCATLAEVGGAWDIRTFPARFQS